MLALLWLITINALAIDACSVTFDTTATFGGGTSYGPFSPGDYGAGTGIAGTPNDGVYSMNINVPTGSSCAVQICEHNLLGYSVAGRCDRYSTETSQTFNGIGDWGISSFSLRDTTGYILNENLACSGRNELGTLDITNIPPEEVFQACKLVCDNAATCVSFEWYTFVTASGRYACVLSETCTTNVATSHVLPDRTLDLYEKTTTLAADCPAQNTFSFDWDLLTSTGGAEIPHVDVTMSIEEADLSLNIDVIVEYVVRAKADNQLTPNFGTTYIFDFEDFDAHKSSIYEPNTCSNRREEDYNPGGNLLNFDDRWVITDYSTDIGTSSNMCYPPPGGIGDGNTGWEITNADCDFVTYHGKWTWGNLRKCKNNPNTPYTHAGNEQTFVDNTDPDYLKLTGTFYINMVSPYWNENNDAYGFYRVYQLWSQPFVIRISKSVYVIGSTGINVMTMSIIAVYKEDQDRDYTLILLTETAEYMELENPFFVQVPTSSDFTLVMQTTSENTGCLNNKAYLCSQLWRIYADDTECITDKTEQNPGGGIDFSGSYEIKFDTLCRDNGFDQGENQDDKYDFNTHCASWFTDHPIYDSINGGTAYQGVALQSDLQFVDEICEAEVFTVQLYGEMFFYENVGFAETEKVDENSQFLYEVGKSTVYGKIVVTFPSATNDILDTELVNVWLCTFPPGTEPNRPDPTNNHIEDYKLNEDGTSGCFSGLRDGFVANSDNIDEEFFFHVYGTQSTPIIQAEQFDVITGPTSESNQLFFKFLVPHEIQRDTLYVHAQIEVSLQSENTPARRLLLNVQSSEPKTNRFTHLGNEIGITHDHIDNKPEPNNYQPYEPQLPAPVPGNPPYTITLTSNWVIIIGGLLSVILGFNIILMCYMNCCKGNRNGRPAVSFNKNRRSGYDSVKHVDSQDFDDSDANLINVN